MDTQTMGTLLSDFDWSTAPSILLGTSVELLNEQVTLLNSANEQLVNSFDSIHNLIRILQEVFTIVGVLLTLLSVIGGASLYRVAKLYIKQEVEREIAKRIERLDVLEELLEQRAILSETTLYFYQPHAKGRSSSEFKMIRKQIKHSSFHSKLNEKLLKSADVIVLDTKNSKLDDQKEGKDIAKKLVAKLPEAAIIVLYTPTNFSPIFKTLSELPNNEKRIEFTSANMKITLMERVVGSAIASAALKK